MNIVHAMPRRLHCWIAAHVALVLVISCFARMEAEELTPVMSVEQIERIKAATVFVQVRARSYLDPESGPFRYESSGTGFVVSEDGHIVTNWHVIDCHTEERGLRLPLRRDELQVIFFSGTPRQQAYPARLLAADERADLAVLQVARTGGPALPLGDSARLRETVPVWICGFPFGPLFSVLQRGPEISINRGLVTCLRHDDRGRLRQIQFDAAVNRGNSGGPLLADDGAVYGITNIAMGTSRINFAIPVAQLHALLETSPLTARSAEDCALTITSAPSGASVYLDGERLGVTPLQVAVQGGHRRFSLSRPGYRHHHEHLAIHDQLVVDRRMVPMVITELRPVARALAPAEAAEHGEALWREDFAQAAPAEDWDQETGGQDQRTWYVEDGALHQFADDELLHAVFAGERDWQHYAVQSRMRIADNPGDGRAGLIVRDTEDGFLLMRLHSGSSRVQIAQHVRSPFGWTILADQSLDMAVETGRWYTMEVQVRGPEVLGLLDGRPVIAARLAAGPIARSGRIGFYAVDAQASFAEARVLGLAAPDQDIELDDSLAVHSFWFTDRFAEHEGLWQAYHQQDKTSPWRLSPGAMMQLDDSAGRRVSLLRRYRISDAQLHAVLTVDGAGAAGLVLRGDKDHGLMAVIARGRAELIEVDDQGRRVLASAAMPVPEGPPPRHHVAVLMQGRTVHVAIDQQMRLSTDRASITSGHIGLVTEDGRGLFHMIGASTAP